MSNSRGLRAISFDDYFLVLEENRGHSYLYGNARQRVRQVKRPNTPSAHSSAFSSHLSFILFSVASAFSVQSSLLSFSSVFFTREDEVHRFGFFGSWDHDNRNNGEANQMKTLHLIVFSSHVDGMDFDAARFCFSAERVAFVRYFVTQYV